MASTNSKIGRPTKYRHEYNEQARQLCLLGYTDAQLAQYFEVNEDTINTWKKTHPQFSESLKAGKAIADAQVAAALHKRAIGFSYQEVTYERILPEDSLDQPIENPHYRKRVVTKMVAPDTGAAMNWLKNRQKDLWRDNLEIDLNKMTDDQLDYLIEKLTKQAIKPT